MTDPASQTPSDGLDRLARFVGQTPIDDIPPAVLERMREEGAIFGRMLQEPAAKEAFSAFLEKRKPVFKGD